MNIIVFEDHQALNLEPISLTRAVFEIRYGAVTLLERIENLCPAASIGLWVRELLVDLTQEIHSRKEVNQSPHENTLWLNARVIWTKELIAEIRNCSSSIFVMEDKFLGANLSKSASDDWINAGGPLSIFNPKGEIHHLKEVKAVHYLWDLLTLIPDAVKKSITSGVQHPNMDAVILDENDGPIVFAENVMVEPFTYLKGPLYIGEGSFVASHSKIKNSVIGPGCKMGGEVSGTIIQGNSNKVHDGYLGDSYLGEWVNLGAGTTNSNLKNNYTPVSMNVNGKEIQSDRLFLGSFIGDHTKTAIGTQLNTGTNIGVGCNILAQTFPKRHIPSFTFYIQGKQKIMNFKNFISTAETVKNRRNLNLSDAEKQILEFLFLSR